MNYPLQVPRTYVNPQGNTIASGVYRSYLTQDMANDFPSWMWLRQNPNSVGQQFLASESILFEDLQNALEYNIRSKFLLTCPLDEIDILYRVKVPGTINLTNASASGIRCIAAPSGYALGGSNQIQVQEAILLEDFYYNVLPTRLEVGASGAYAPSINGTSWNTIPSGIPDRQSKLYDQWKTKHDLTWCYSNGYIHKQDAKSLEDYELYSWTDSGTIVDMWYDNGMIWLLGQYSSGCYLSLVSSKTQMPQLNKLDYLAKFDLGGVLPSGETFGNIMVDSSGFMWAADSTKKFYYPIMPRYDYFTLDQKTRYIYFREDYSNSGVFISNT